MAIDKKFYPYFFIAIIAVLVVANGAFFYSKGRSSEAIQKKGEQVALKEVNEALQKGDRKRVGKAVSLKAEESDYFLGNKDAEIAMIVYDDPSEPFASRYYGVLQKITEEFKELKVIIRLLPLEVNDNSDYYDSAVACGGEQGKFFESYEAVLNAKKEGRLTIDGLSSILESAGLDMDKYRQCSEANIGIQKLGQWKQEAEENAIIGVPSTFINNHPFPGAYQLDDFVDSAGHQREGLRSFIRGILEK